MYVAYQMWQRPSYMSGPHLEKRIYGKGDTPKAAIFDACYTVGSDGQVRQRANCPNACDLHTEERAD